MCLMTGNVVQRCWNLLATVSIAISFPPSRPISPWQVTRGWKPFSVFAVGASGRRRRPPGPGCGAPSTASRSASGWAICPAALGFLSAAAGTTAPREFLADVVAHLSPEVGVLRGRPSAAAAVASVRSARALRWERAGPRLCHPRRRAPLFSIHCGSRLTVLPSVRVTRCPPRGPHVPLGGPRLRPPRRSPTRRSSPSTRVLVPRTALRRGLFPAASWGCSQATPSW